MDDNQEFMAEVFEDAVDEAARQLEKAVAAANVETVLSVIGELIDEAWLGFQEDPSDTLHWDEIADWLGEMREFVADKLIPVVFDEERSSAAGDAASD